MKIKAWNKTLLILFLPIVVVIFFGLFFYQNSLKLIQNTSVVSNTVEEMTRIRKIRSDFKVLETREKDFLKSGRKESLGSYNATLNLVWQDFDHVWQLLQDNPDEEKKLFKDVKTVIVAISAEYKKVNTVRLLQGAENIQEPVVMDDVPVLVEDFQRSIIQMLEIETQLLKERNLDQLSTSKIQNLMSIVAILITLLFSLITIILVYKILRNNQDLNESRLAALKLVQESQEAKKEALEAGKQREEFAKSLVLRNFEMEETRLAALNIAQDAKESRERVETLSSYQKAILDSAGHSIISTTVDGIITSFNPAAEKMLGYKAEEVVNKETPQIIHDKEEVVARAKELSEELKEDILPGFEVFVAKSRRNLPNTYEWTYIRKDGSRFPVLLSVTALRSSDGNISGYLGIGSDISDLKKAQEDLIIKTKELQESENFLKTVFENIPYMIFIKDAKDLKFVRLNKAGEELLGIQREEMIGKSDYDFFPKEEADFFILKDREVLSSDHTLDIPQESINTKGKGQRFLHTKKLRVLSVDGHTPRYLLGLSEDITERIIVEERLKHTLLDLERSNRDLEQFAYVASHDLQEPLRMVASFTQLLERKYKDQLDDKAKEYIYFAVDGAKRMQELIDDLLMFSRAGLKDVPKTTVDLNVVCQRVLKDLGALVEENKATVHIDPMPMVWANETQMSQLFLNLMGNAIKYRSERDPIIKLSAHKINDKQWEFTVSDNGIGIEEQYYEKLFVIFQRLHTKREYKGTGIGLALCKKIVENHNGRIWVTSRFGEGTTFHFILNEGDKA